MSFYKKKALKYKNYFLIYRVIKIELKCYVRLFLLFTRCVCFSGKADKA